MNAPLSKEQIALLMSDSMTTRSVARPGLLSRLRAVFGAWVEHRTVLTELRGLSDRELTDIGLNRADLPRVFDPAFARSREHALLRAANV